MTLCLFLAAAAMINKTGSGRLEDIEVFSGKSPVTMACFIVGALAMIKRAPYMWILQ